jgi:bifunctional ADP-heptose synthase (sugar kinase/adenylyltransferase)
MLDEAKMRRTLERLGGLTIAVVGDLFLDKYLDLDARLTEKSVETGCDAFQVVRVRTSPGAGGTVLNNLAALGVGRLAVISVIGSDGEGFELKRALLQRGVATELLIEAPDRFTPTYTKPMLDEGTAVPRELDRLDVKNRTPTPSQLESAICAHLRQAFYSADALIIADQVEEPDCGVMTTAVRDHLAELAAGHPEKLVLADSRAHIGLYHNVSLKPNLAECIRATTPPEGQGEGPQSTPPLTKGGQGGVPATICARDLDRARRSAEQLARRAGRDVFCTLGEQGILHTDGSHSEHVPGYPVSGPIDIVGAGDATTAGIACGLCTGLSPTEAAALGNLVASVTIRQLGTTGTATPEQVLARWSELNAAGR